MGFVDTLKSGLKKTKEALFTDVEVLFSSRKIDEATIEEFEETLLSSDIGINATTEIVETLLSSYRSGNLKRYEDVKDILRRSMLDILGLPQPFVLYQERPFVVLCVGVNGVGKTTTIGKLAHRSIHQGHSVILAASDTFRAAAIEQLDIWSRRAGAQIVKHQGGSDPAAVAFDAIEAAKARGIDLCIVDTAGRLHTKSPLMDELKKIKKVIGKAIPGAPHETLLVVDATTGQNALHQARIFNEAVGVTGIALTKLDGTAKGGIVLAIKKELNIPIRLIGVGEGIDDFRDFIPAEFVSALCD
ncbi:MAG: signal recognition particle-docking protein FtsY [Candidatus Magnetobacterium sp. LHC-1]|uniref:Signal recognition particle receptor FtsY n=1 Tax=Candidatus Magnetobacterium casense TaxID=1455061 RepID=A0ABS6RW79_9BACT|nr:signal recognition particle-docking protein FtsY [Candidatus Magnetobacterium casensis]MBF0607909.1 signal recognition particle-docking protein FtsY [Nitrospirota bacterium]MBV6340881.1 signal recognition particle-docking protein FtsY [Candidatus Magnetobacterium casensis]